MHKTSSRPSSKHLPKNTFVKIVIILLVILILLVSLGHRTLNKKQKTNPPKITTAAPSTNINLDPPTQEEKKITEENKTKNLNESVAPPTIDSNGLRAVTPVISYADKNGASAYINGIFEEGGTCMAEYSHGDDKITTTSTGFQNSNYTSCEPLTLPGPLNIKGDWSLIVSYKSTTSSGKSASMLVRVD
ncbi:MAG: hypothetical protein JWO47_951 [Candidatus Saccharibacteria bacterium]|nr:hypothetical protein [Candidatus Saccharibacteria bacterium]